MAVLTPPPTTGAGIAYLVARGAFRRRLKALEGLAAFLAPFDGTCPMCRERVLILLGGRFVVERRPILARYPCPRCADIAKRGNTRRRVCDRCKGSGWLGEPLPVRGVAVAADGQAREFSSRRPPLEAETAHREHECEGPSAPR